MKALSVLSLVETAPGFGTPKEAFFVERLCNKDMGRVSLRIDETFVLVDEDEVEERGGVYEVAPAMLLVPGMIVRLSPGTEAFGTVATPAEAIKWYGRYGTSRAGLFGADARSHLATLFSSKEET